MLILKTLMKSFKYNAKLLGYRLLLIIDANRASGILKSTTITVPLKYQCIFGDHLKRHRLIEKLNWNLNEQGIVF